MPRGALSLFCGATCPRDQAKGVFDMNIYIGNLSYDAGENDIREAFEEFGSVDSVKIIMDRMTNRSKGFGFVEMSNDDEARKAIGELNGKEHLGRALKVNEAKPRENRSNSW